MSEIQISEAVQSLLGADADRVAAGATLQQLAAAEPASLPDLIIQLRERAERLDSSDPAILGGLLRVLQQLAARAVASEPAASDAPATATPEPSREPSSSSSPEETTPGSSRGSVLAKIDPAAIRTLAQSLPERTPNRHLLLYLLAAARTAASLQMLAELLATSPPDDWMAVGQVLSPLMQHRDWEPSDFFPAAFDALSHPSAAAPILDLANFLTRTGRVSEHPGSSRGETLAALLGGVSGRLGQFEEDPRSFGSTVEEVQKVLSEAVALAVSLCDAFGLIGWEGAIPKLNQAMELAHRRVQSEAAGALARLGNEEGRERLLALAAEPSTRLRVMAYAEELGFADAIAEEYTTDEARAEAEMALWLSQPQQMAVPPTAVEVIDRRTLYWPSYASPTDCFLVRFEYNLGERNYSNVGITGPMVHAVGADVADLPVDDIYAIYAGWQAEHEDIFTVPAERWNAAQKRLAKPLVEHLDRMGFEQLEPVLLGFILDEHALVARAVRDETACLVVTDGLEVIDHPTQGRQRPLGTEEIWNLFLGRKLLRTFN
ncbi:HEAT repeat domain-containing protein [Candidatus Laterigemmans baculatus]|uniref:HEAT repeat domain-containing protein n=1 Tax=Candidatus Laterigemmans baculatus TaxID=2770505 RepID=UPI0013D9E9D9|nr:HEAT repeat domain-containing protein [Candidatus Laterigemmans baculatus]